MRTKKIASFVVCAVLLAVPGSSRAQDYGATMAREVRKAFKGQQFKHYEWLTYPTNNFGVMTMFIVQKRGDNPKSEDQNCATFTCLGLTPDDVAKLSAKQIKTVKGFADTGTGGSIEFTDKEKKSLALSVVIPKILGLLNISGNVDLTKGIDATLTLGAGTLRFLAKDNALNYITHLPADSRIHKAYDNGTLCIVVSDVMLDSMEVKMTIDKGVNAGLDASLSGKVNQVFSDGDKLQVKVGSNTDGSYTLKVTKPVIVSRLIASQPFGKVRGTDFKAKLASWNDGWIPTPLSEAESHP